MRSAHFRTKGDAKSTFCELTTAKRNYSFTSQTARSASKRRGYDVAARVARIAEADPALRRTTELAARGEVVPL